MSSGNGSHNILWCLQGFQSQASHNFYGPSSSTIICEERTLKQTVSTILSKFNHIGKFFRLVQIKSLLARHSCYSSVYVLQFGVCVCIRAPVCVFCLSEFVETITSTIVDGFQNNLQLFSITCRCAIWKNSFG